MSGSVNKVILVGRCTRDPEVRGTQDGKKIVNLNIATSESWKDRMSGERKEKSEFHRVVVFNDRLADVAERFLKKGSTVYIEGSLQTRKWTDQSGAEKYATEVVLQQYRGELTLLDKAPGRQEDDDAGYGSGSRNQGERAPSGGAGGFGGGFGRGPTGLDEEIPFAPIRDLP